MDQTFYKAGFEVYPAAVGADTRPSGLLVKPLLEGGTGVSLPLGTTSLRWTVDGAVGDAIGFAMFPGDAGIVGGDGAIGTSVVLASAGTEPTYLLGNARTSRIEIAGWSVGLSLEGSPTDPEIRFRAAAQRPDGTAGARIFIPLEDADEFVKQTVKQRAIEFAFAAEVVWSSKTGLTFGGRPTLDIGLPLLIDLGPVTLTDARIALGGRSGRLTIRLTTGVRGSFGPVGFVIEDVGLEVGVTRRTRQQIAEAPAGGDGSTAATFGNLDASVAFVPPEGIGLVIDAGPVKGGGFLRFDRERGAYGGALELVVGRLEVKSYGLLTVRSGRLLADHRPLGRVPGADYAAVRVAPGRGRRAARGAPPARRPGTPGRRSAAAPRGSCSSRATRSRPRRRSSPRWPPSSLPAKGQFLVGPLFRLFWGATRSRDAVGGSDPRDRPTPSACSSSAGWT